MDNTSYSEHLFLFPFSWKLSVLKNIEKTYLHNTIDINRLDQLENWEMEYANLQEDKDYNEFVYFYKSVRAALYTFKDTPKIVRNYCYKHLDKQNEFVIVVQGKTYYLTIKKISLKLYKSGIGIMAIHLINFSYKNPEEILYINSFSKCVYPYVLPIEKAKADLFPDYIKMKVNENRVIEERFDKDYKNLPITISNIIMNLLGEPFALTSQTTSALVIEPILGSQMFVVCAYQQSQMVEEINGGNFSEEFLEKFILLNERIKCHNESNKGIITDMEYIKSKETIYGTSRFSLMAISKHIVDIKIYDQLIHLLLMQRATLLSFSNELALVSALNKKELVPGIQNIYEVYIQFINQLYFKEVTEEIQGTQIYDSLSKQLRIEEELHQLDFEIEEVHEYAMLIEQSQYKNKMNKISAIGAALVIPTFVTGFFGMNILQKDWYDWWNHKEVILWINAYVILPMLIVIAIYTWNQEKGRRNIIQKIVILLSIGGALLALVYCGAGIPCR